MKRIAIWVALAHGIGIVAALLLVQSPAFEPPTPILIRLQSELPAVPSVSHIPPKTSALPKQLAPSPQLVTAPTKPVTAPITPAASLAITTLPLETKPAAIIAAPAVNSGAAQESAAARPMASPSATGSDAGTIADDRQPMVDASYRGNRVPDYPVISRRLGEQGIVVLRVLITSDGRASDVQLVKTSGSSRLDGAAMETVKEWRFVPALKGGRPVAAWYEWRWEFRLHQ
ncbi:MAG: energy transducer TonB [Burkholderiaceae bacterium]|nr:energy transducer TonB [Burkholderiaceae bacterium]